MEDILVRNKVRETLIANFEEMSPLQLESEECEPGVFAYLENLIQREYGVKLSEEDEAEIEKMFYEVKEEIQTSR